MRIARFLEVFGSPLAPLLAVGAMAPTAAHGYSFGTIVVAGVDPQVCRIERPDGSPTCSGTLVGKARLLTAGHCAFEKRAGEAEERDIRGYTVACLPTMQAGGKVVFGIRRKVTAVNRNAQYLAKTLSHDTAFLTLDAPVLNIVPASLDFDVWSLASTTECSVEGYGNNKDGIAGFPAKAPLSESRRKQVLEDLPAEARTLKLSQSVSFDARTDVAEVNRQFKRWLDEVGNDGIVNRQRRHDAVVRKLISLGGTLPWAFAPGDSGGPLLCRTKPSGEPFVVAVNSSTTLPDSLSLAASPDGSAKFTFKMNLNRSFIPDPEKLADYTREEGTKLCMTDKRGIPDSKVACERELRDGFSRQGCLRTNVACKLSPGSYGIYYCEVSSLCPSTDAFSHGADYDPPKQ